MVPGEVTIIALFRLVALELGSGNSWTALVVPAVASPTGVFLFRQHFASITPELSEGGTVGRRESPAILIARPIATEPKYGNRADCHYVHWRVEQLFVAPADRHQPGFAGDSGGG